jgi:hypothetical protein
MTCLSSYAACYKKMKSKIENRKSKIPKGHFVVNHPGAALILLAFISLAVIYSLVTQPFEAGDESRHYAVVKYMADTGRLPVQAPGELQVHASHEVNQPPLYYALAAALTFWIDTGDWNDVFWYNPHTTIGNPLRPDNKNITIHPPGEGWPWRGHVLAVHLIRFLSIAMAAVTVTTTYALALSLFKGQRWPAAGAMAITAFNPMFIFISASVNNDNAVIMFVTLALWVMVQLARGQWLSPLQGAALLGLLIGLGALSKLYALGLLPLAGLLFLWLAFNRPQKTIVPTSPQSATPALSKGQAASVSNPQSLIPNPQSACRMPQSAIRRFFFWTLTTAAIACAVAGWFYLRNAVLYNGDVLALQIMRDTAGQRTAVPSLATLRAEFEGFRIAYWALFGGVNILADAWIYTVLDVVSLVAALGVIAFIVVSIRPQRTPLATPTDNPHAAIRMPQSRISNLQSPISNTRYTLRTTHYALRTLAILLAWYLIMMAGFIVWNLTQPAGQGRLLYPATAAISALGMLGLTWWLPARGQKVVVELCVGGLFAFAALSPFLYIAPAYAKPPRLTQSDLPSDLKPVDYIYDGKMRLIGYQLHTDTVHPAQAVPVTLYWQLLEPVDLDYSIFIHLLGRDRAVIGQIDTYPGGGKWPTTLLKPGDILADDYEVPIAPQAEFEHAPTRLLIAAGIYDFHEPGRPGKPATNTAGDSVEPIIASAKLIPWQWPSPPRGETPINFFDKVTLLSHDISTNKQAVTLNWQVKQPFETDYTVFLQVLEADTNEYVTGFDGPPVRGNYPTSLWAPGETIVDTHRLDLATLAPGDYRLVAGLYDPDTQERLPAFGPDGPLPGDAVDLGIVQIEEGSKGVGSRE